MVPNSYNVTIRGSSPWIQCNHPRLSFIQCNHLWLSPRGYNVAIRVSQWIQCNIRVSPVYLLLFCSSDRYTPTNKKGGERIRFNSQLKWEKVHPGGRIEDQAGKAWQQEQEVSMLSPMQEVEEAESGAKPSPSPSLPCCTSPSKVSPPYSPHPPK